MSTIPFGDSGQTPLLYQHQQLSSRLASLRAPAVFLTSYPNAHLWPSRFQTEKHLSELVVAKAVVAKIDRPSGIITFGKRGVAEEVLNAWSGNIGQLLALVEKSCQQIQKEAMVHKVQLGRC